MLLERQLVYFGHVARMPDDSTIRACVFQPGSLELAQHMFKKRRGRPLNQWPTEVRKHAVNVFTDAGLHEAVLDEHSWRKRVRQYCV